MSIFSAALNAAEKTATKIKAYHGSPHDFDKFSSDSIGTGEGAQAYGHGLYFAEREGTAEGYRNALTNTSFKKSDGAAFDPYDGSMSHPNIRAHITKTDGDLDGAVEKAQKIIKDNSSRQSVDAATNDLSVLQKIKEDGGILKNKGSMYEVNIDASPDEMLDYDLPLSEQSDFVKSRLPQPLLDRPNARGINAVQDYPLPNSEMMGNAEYSEQASAALRESGIKGIKYADAQTRFSSQGKTHNYVVFDDKTVEIARKYGVSMPVAGAILAGTITPEDAQAGALTQGAKRIIDQRFSNPVAASNPRKGVLANTETMPAGIDSRNMDMGDNLNIEDFEGHPYIMTQSDRSAAGGTLNSIKDQVIDGVNLRGGRDFMFDPESEGQVWASFPSVVDGLHSRAGELKRQTGKNPLLMPYAMAPTGIDFATMPLDAMVNYARQGMSKANVRKLDSKIKKVMPNWSGVMNPESNSQFKNVTGDTRKAVAKIIDLEFRDVNGGLSMGEARAATSASDQYLIPDGSLRNAGIIDPSKPVLADSGHPTYLGGLQGEGLGRFTDSMNARAFAEANGRVLTGGPSDIRALSMNHELQQGIVDERLLRFLEEHKKKLSLVGGVGAAGGTQASEDDSFKAVMAERDDRTNMSRRDRRNSPASEGLREYSNSQILPTLGNIAQGALKESASTMDYLSPANVARLLLNPADEGLKRFVSEPIMQGVGNLASPLTEPLLLDRRDPKAQKQKQKNMGLGSLFGL